MSSPTAVAVSATGKVLFAGGFLVLDRKHTGLVFGLNARIHVHIQPWLQLDEDRGEHRSADARSSILVQSPQFQDAKWLYSIDAGAEHGDVSVQVTQTTNLDKYSKSRNKFVEITLQYCLTYLLHTKHDVRRHIQITILADDDYYSQSGSDNPIDTRKGFKDFGVKLSDAHKTGLGSSAALVTSLVASLLTFFASSPQLPTKIIHNLAQAAHCAAQGKVGSGFDVAAAVFGSCLYRRFTPSILENVGDSTNAGFGEKLHRCVEDLDLDRAWDAEISSRAVQIPESLLLVMCDVDCGSETPGMVRKVLQWRKDNPAEADVLWNAIQQGTEELCRQLREFSSGPDISMKGQQDLGDTIQTIRSFVREMSLKSDVPIEPDVITKLLDYCTELPGVIGGVAPGAGGYDAVALLLRNDSETLRDLQNQLQLWQTAESSSGPKIGRVRLLGVQQAREGLRLEDVNQYSDWVK